MILRNIKKHLPPKLISVSGKVLWKFRKQHLSTLYQNQLPNLFILGAPKSGSTWLYQLLKAHPDIYMSPTKEPRFFNNTNKLANVRAWRKYISLFETGREQQTRYLGEATPGYIWVGPRKGEYTKMAIRYNRNTPKTFDHILGTKVKLILVLRNPIERAISHYLHHYRVGRIDNQVKIFECMNNYPETFEMGLYERHLSGWKQYYSDNSLLVVLFEDIKRDPRSIAKAIFDFLELDMLPNYDFKAVQNPGYSLTSIKGDITVGDTLLTTGEKSKLIQNIAKKKNANDPKVSVFQQNSLNKNQLQSKEPFPIIKKKELDKLFSLYKKDIEFVEQSLDRKLNEWKTLQI